MLTNKLILKLELFLLISSFSINAYSQNTIIATLSGKCLKVIAMDVFVEQDNCIDKVMNIEYPNGRNGFKFILTSKNGSTSVISFSGDGSNQVYKDKDHAKQLIDRVIFTFNGSTDDLKAVGSCSFENPYLGKPVKILCSADTSQGKFSGEFISNGISPDVSEM